MTLDRGEKDASGGIQQEFAQELARTELEPQQPVRAQTPGQLVHSVHIQTAPGMMVLTFKDRADQPLATLQLAPLPLRQWLNIVHDQFRQASWPTTPWPYWMEKDQPTTKPSQPMLQ